MSPGLEIKPLLAELRERVMEELDYTLEANSQRAFAAAYADDPNIAVPRVVASAPKAVVTEWMDGTPLSRIIAEGTEEQRNDAGMKLALLHYSAPSRAGMLHADPHPGNFRILADGRMGVVDFGAVARLPDGYPEPLGRLTRAAVDGDGELALEILREQGFILPGVTIDARQVMDYLGPTADPLREETFTFSRRWLRRQAAALFMNMPASVGRRTNQRPARDV